MKHKPYLYLLIAAAIGSALLGIFADSGSILLTVLQFPLAPIAKGLRSLSLSGTVGNLLAWGLYLLLCTLPLIPFAKLRHRRKSDALLLVLIPVLAVTVYRLINPTGLLAGTEAGLAMYRAQYGGVVYAVLLGWLILRTAEAFRSADEAALYRAMELFVLLLGILFVISAFGEGLASLLGEIDRLRAANQNSGSLTLSYVFLTLEAIRDALPALLNTVTALMALELLEHREDGIVYANRLAKWCGTSLTVTALAYVVFHLLQMIFLPQLRNLDMTLRFPIPSLAFLLVCLIAARMVEENKALRDENELYI